jgi:hypothetical protein
VSVIWAIAAIAVQWLLGDALLRLCGSSTGQMGRGARLGLAFGAGMVGVAVVSLQASLVGLHVDLLPMAGLAVSLRLLARGLHRDGVHPAEPGVVARPAARWVDYSLLAYLTVWMLLLSITCLLEPVVEWDVIAIWAFKAKILVSETIASTQYLSDPTRAYSHLDYPLLWPLNLAWVWRATGGTDLAVIKLLGVALLTCFVLSFHGLLARRGDTTAALAVSALLFSIPIFQAQLIRLVADGPLIYFTFAMVTLSFCWLETSEKVALRMAAIFCVGCLLTKNEGIMLWGLWTVCVLVRCVLARGAASLRAAAIWLVAVPALLTAPWFLLRTGIPKLHEDYGSRLSPLWAMEHLDRLPDVISRAWMYLGAFDDWLLFWPALLLVLVLTARHWISTGALVLFAFAQMSLAAYAYMYVVTPWSLPVLMEASASRLILHVVPVECLLLAEAARSAGLWPWPARISHQVPLGAAATGHSKSSGASGRARKRDWRRDRGGR